MYPDDAASPVNTDGGSGPDGAGDFPANNDSSCISVKSLWKVFGKNSDKALSAEYEGKDKTDILAELGCVVALQDVSFDVGRGETFVVMGLSGSGKSTLVRCLIRLIEPTSGQIFIDDQDILEYDDAQLTEIRRKKVAMVFQHYGLLPHRRVIDNAAWGLELRGVDQTSRYAQTQEVLDLVGLTGREQAYPRELSGGMQQRVGLARALAVDPDILLMDEPFSGLDPLIRRNMQDELIRLQRELHKTIVFITHDLDEALKIGDRIAIMRDGKIVQIGPPEAIVLNPANEYVAEFTRDVRRESILKASGVMTAPPGALRRPDSQDGVGGPGKPRCRRGLGGRYGQPLPGGVDSSARPEGGPGWSRESVGVLGPRGDPGFLGHLVRRDHSPQHGIRFTNSCGEQRGHLGG